MGFTHTQGLPMADIGRGFVTSDGLKAKLYLLDQLSFSSTTFCEGRVPKKPFHNETEIVLFSDLPSYTTDVILVYVAFLSLQVYQLN